MSTTIILETTALTASRILLFLAARKYLLRSIYTDLKSISSSANESPRIDEPQTGIELNSLPTPITTPRNSFGDHVHPKSTFHFSAAKNVFSSCFSESCTLFLLLILQATGIFSPQTRLYNWKFSLAFLVGTILIVVPLCLSLMLSLDRSSSDSTTPLRQRIKTPSAIASTLFVLLYLFAFSYVPLPSLNQRTGTDNNNLVTTALARLIVLGTIILGLLSGFGAVSSAWGYLPFLSSHRSTTKSGRGNDEMDISRLEQSLAGIRKELETRRNKSMQGIAGTSGFGISGTPPMSNSSSSSSGWLSTFRGRNNDQEELQGLLALEQNMSASLTSMYARRASLAHSRTFRGRIGGLVGRAFAVYCVLRIASAFVNLCFPSSTTTTTAGQTYPDVLTDLLVWFLNVVSPGDAATGGTFDRASVAQFSRQLGLMLVGVIILNSLRVVLRGVTRVLRVTSQNLAASVMLLFLAQLMGIYLLSTLVQARKSFPPPPTPSPPMSATLGVLPNDLASPTSLSEILPGSHTPTTTPTTSATSATSTTTITTPTTTTNSDVINLFTTWIPEFELFGYLFDGSFVVSAVLSTAVRWGVERVG